MGAGSLLTRGFRQLVTTFKDIRRDRSLLFFLAGADIKQIVFILILATFMGWLIVQFSVTGQDRVTSFLAGLQDPTNASYHVQRSFEAVIKGGFGDALTRCAYIGHDSLLSGFTLTNGTTEATLG